MFNRVIRFITLLAAVLAVTLIIIAPANAADIRKGEKLVVPAGEVVNDDLYLFGSGITVDGTVNGDIIAFGDNVAINGPVNGRVNCAARDITVKGQVRDSVRVAASTVDIYSDVGGDLVAAASQVNIQPSGSVGRDFLVAAGTVRVDGPVGKGILGSIGNLVINSSVGGSVDVECRTLNLEPGASVSGDLTYRSENIVQQAKDANIKGQLKQVVPPQPKPGPSAESIGQVIAGAAAAIVGFMVILLIVIAVFKYIAALLTGIIFILIARKYIPGLVETLKSKPWPCLGYGALFFFLAPIAIAIAFMLIIGIPLGLAGLALYALAVYLGHIFIGLFIGKWMLRQHADTTLVGPLVGALALGLLVVYMIAVIPVIGCLSDLAAILFGLGAICLWIKTKLGGSAA
jgi:cytoskeletal protein CcmA (bactofilin family)